MNQTELTRIFSKIPIIQTPRLRLRRMRVSDDGDMYEYACRESVTRYLLWDPHASREYTKRYLTVLQGMYRSGTFFDWGIEDPTKKKMIGTCGFTTFDLPNNRAEIGYVLSPDYWGMGIAPEAVMAVMEFGFASLGLHRIEAHYIFGNDRSRRVMEKCGMCFEGICRGAMLIKGKYRDIGVCAILAEDFFARYGKTLNHFGTVIPQPFSFFF